MKISTCKYLWLTLFLVTCAPICAFTADIDGQVRLFVVEKSKNPENILVVYCKVSDACELIPIADAGGDHFFDFYWLMNRATYKRTHPLIKKLARKRFVARGNAEKPRGFKVLLTDLKELVHDLPSEQIEVKFFRTPGGRCQARTLLELGPSSDNRMMQINSIYSKAKTLFGLPVGIHYIELRGVDTRSEKEISVRFNRNEEVDFDYHSIPDGYDHR